MANAKVTADPESVNALIQSWPEPSRADAETIMRIMSAATGAPARLWDRRMIGFGEMHYRYGSGHEGDTFETGFALRSGKFSIHVNGLMQGRAQLLARLGKHRMATGCLYVNRLQDVDVDVLQEIVVTSVKQLRAMVAERRAESAAGVATRRGPKRR